MNKATWLDPLNIPTFTEGEPNEAIVIIPSRRMSEDDQTEWDNNYIPFPRDEE